MMQMLSVIANRWPIQLLGPPENARTDIDHVLVGSAASGGWIRTGIAWPFIGGRIKEPFRFEFFYIIAPVNCCG